MFNWTGVFSISITNELLAVANGKVVESHDFHQPSNWFLLNNAVNDVNIMQGLSSITIQKINSFQILIWTLKIISSWQRWKNHLGVRCWTEKWHKSEIITDFFFSHLVPITSNVYFRCSTTLFFSCHWKKITPKGRSLVINVTKISNKVHWSKSLKRICYIFSSFFRVRKLLNLCLTIR